MTPSYYSHCPWASQSLCMGFGYSVYISLGIFIFQLYFLFPPAVRLKCSPSRWFQSIESFSAIRGGLDYYQDEYSFFYILCVRECELLGEHRGSAPSWAVWKWGCWRPWDWEERHHHQDLVGGGKSVSQPPYFSWGPSGNDKNNMAILEVTKDNTMFTQTIW